MNTRSITVVLMIDIHRDLHRSFISTTTHAHKETRVHARWINYISEVSSWNKCQIWVFSEWDTVHASACVCVCGGGVHAQLHALLRRVHCAVFHFSTDPVISYWRLQPSTAILCCRAHTHARAHAHTCDYTIHGFHIRSHSLWLAVTVNAVKNDRTFSYLLTLTSIRGDGVSGSGSTLKVMLSNKAPQTPVKWSHYIKRYPITVTIHLSLCSPTVLPVKI